MYWWHFLWSKEKNNCGHWMLSWCAICLQLLLQICSWVFSFPSAFLLCRVVFVPCLLVYAHLLACLSSLPFPHLSLLAPTFPLVVLYVSSTCPLLVPYLPPAPHALLVPCLPFALHVPYLVPMSPTCPLSVRYLRLFFLLGATAAAPSLHHVVCCALRFAFGSHSVCSYMFVSCICPAPLRQLPHTSASMLFEAFPATPCLLLVLLVLLFFFFFLFLLHSQFKLQAFSFVLVMLSLIPFRTWRSFLRSLCRFQKRHSAAWPKMELVNTVFLPGWCCTSRFLEHVEDY